MKIISSVILFLGLLTLQSAEKLVDYRLNLSLNATPKNCTTAGLLCETCSSLVACVQSTGNIFKKEPVKTCPTGQKCIKNACTSESDPFCDGVADLPFICPQAGIFPDPFYCNKFFLCVEISGKLQAYSNKCEDGLGYNIGTGLCDKILENSKCPEDQYPVPLCQTVGDSGILENKPQEFYMCKEYTQKQNVLYPFISVCPHATKYNNFACTE